MVVIVRCQTFLISGVIFLVFKDVQWWYLMTIVSLYLIFGLTRNISERFSNGKTINSAILKRLLWIKKNESYISYPSLVFVILGYIYLIAIIPCNIVCLFVSELTAKWITGVYLGVMNLTVLIEAPFLPFYGVKG